MTENVWKHLPYAIYLDTNVLRSAGTSLEAPWLNELLSITNAYGISLCISELVLAEWCEYINGVLESNRQKLLSAMGLLKNYNAQLPDIKPNEVNLPEKTQLIEMVSHKLKALGFNIIKNWDAPLSQLLSEAVSKKPPFEQGGKGLCDAVILESYIKHAKENLPKAKVLVVSKDNAVKRSEDRFKEHEIAVEFINESDIVEKLKSLFNDEVTARIEDKESRLKKYVLTYEPTILDYVRKTPVRITDWMLLTEKEDRIDGSIESILSVRPTRISYVIGGLRTYGEETPPNRYPVQIFVEIELDVLVRQYGFEFLRQTRAVVQPNMIDKDSPVNLEKSTTYQPQEIVRTITRDVTVCATIDAEKEKENIFDDFRIEKLI